MRKNRVRLGSVLLALLLAVSVFMLPSASAGELKVQDEKLKAALQTVLGTQTITTEQMRALTSLNLSGKGIRDLTGLEAAVNLKNLSLRNNKITSVGALTGLTALVTLDVSENQISSVEPLVNMENLRALHLTKNKISSLSPLTSLKKLQFLFCEDNCLGTDSAAVKTLRSRGCYVTLGNQEDPPPPASSDSTSSEEEEPKLTAAKDASAVIRKKDSVLVGVSPGTPVSGLKSLVTVDGSGTLSVTDDRGNAVTSGNLGTGMQILLKNSAGKTVETLTVLVYGDINGDGAVSVFDLVLLRKQIVGAAKLSGVCFEAANLNAAYRSQTDDTTVNVMDLVLLRKLIVGALTMTGKGNS